MPAPVKPRGCRGVVDPIAGRRFTREAFEGLQKAALHLGGEVLVSTWDKTPISNQGGLGSCVANAVCDALEISMAKEGRVVQLSRLALYWFSRALHGEQLQENGTFIDKALLQAETVGVLPESDWPYIESKVLDEPDNVDIMKASDHRVRAYYALPSEGLGDAMEVSLRADLSIVYASMLDKRDYAAPKPDAIIGPPEVQWGWHAQIVIGFALLDDGSRIFRVRNSWGEDWGDGGCIWVRESYLTNSLFANSFFAITRVPDLVF